MNTDPRVDAYIDKVQPFAQPILREIRARLHEAAPDLTETIKWGMPFFEYRGRPFANMAAFKAHAAFGFWQRAATQSGREGEAMGQRGRLTSIADLPGPAEWTALVEQAKAASGSPPRPRAPSKPEAEVPPALAAALVDDDVARTTFEGFPPSARRDYCEWIGEAKRDETRDRRLAEAIKLLREGKRRYWK